MPGAELVFRAGARLNRGRSANPLRDMLHRLTHMVSCKEASRLLSQGEERRLSPGVRIKLRLHLMACTGCTRFKRQIDFMRDAMARYRQ